MSLSISCFYQGPNFFPKLHNYQTGRPVSLPTMQEAPVIVVGAGASGLAASACLTRHSIPYILLEREDCYAALWQKYTYDRLHLHLRKQVCQLPHMPFPPSYPHYVPRKQFIQYLDDYVNHFHIRPCYQRAVELAQYDEAHNLWRIQARNRNSGEVEHYAGRFLVVASGETAEPRVPETEGLDTFKGKVLHSTGYKNGEQFKDERVLVVGSGNSGMEIALDLANYGARPSIIARSPVHFMNRDMMHYASLLLRYMSRSTVENLLVMWSRIMYGDLTKYGLPWPREGPFTMKLKYGKFPIIDVGTVQKIRSGEIQVLQAEIERIRGKEVVLKDGKSLPFDSIVFCTGFKGSTHKWLKGDDYLLKEDGLAKQAYPNHWKGRNGLYCVGLSQMGFRGAGLDAQKIADDIASLLQSHSHKTST
ncbi:probable indole-3-pyruvate monooxygenase YUCCA10 [Neltuma alba]|uniref:probable indole-3-pyruvate monooxygenase YUCCA10 n=1 Tax=Neltuma alba TaxID=207710 RepID=UPI0010A38633|nr:probable indole-3-pyruvate monooxygenase YUCCA10 [Prosopis alba]XP_028804171.1 probable indole-3-pyruvate monooxygenase YUCCA10 [Prosopis alba]